MDGAAQTTVRWELRGAARKMFTAVDKEIGMVGAAGTGKSLPCLLRLHLTCLAKAGMRCLILRKTAISLGATTLVTFEQEVAAEAIAAGLLSWYGGSQREAASYRYSNGSAIVVGGLDKPVKIMSSAYDMVFVDEATELTERDWEMVGTRLRHFIITHQVQMLACNPDAPTHWIKQRADRGALRLLTSRHVDNPAYFHPDGTPTSKGRSYLDRLDALTGVRRLRLREGKWAAAEGLVYEMWDPAAHMIDRFPIPADWPAYWSVDFGFNHPFVAQCWRTDHDGRLILEWEIFRTGRLVEDHAAVMLDQVTSKDPHYRHPSGGDPQRAHHGRTWTGPRPRTIICDHDAEDRATLERHLGMSTVPARKSVSDGIQEVKTRLKIAGDGKPRIMIMRDTLVEHPDRQLEDARRPKCTAEEFPSYIWDTGPARAVADGRPPKEVPVKEHDDGMDAMRYMVAELDLGRRPGMRWLG